MNGINCGVMKLTFDEVTNSKEYFIEIENINELKEFCILANGRAWINGLPIEQALSADWGDVVRRRAMEGCLLIGIDNKLGQFAVFSSNDTERRRIKFYEINPYCRINIAAWKELMEC